MVASSVTITVSALATMLRTQNIGEPPLVIRPDAVWTDRAGDRAAEATAWAEFREIQWVDQRGHLDGEALDSLHALVRPSVEYSAVLVADGRQTCVVVAGHGDQAVIAYRQGEAVTLSLVRHQSLPETLLRQIPDARPAPIEAVNVRLSDLAAMRPDGAGLGGNGLRSASDTQTLGLLMKRRLVGQGELYVGVRDHFGRRQTSAPVRYQDYKPGRVVVVVGGGYLSVAPATKRLLLTRLQQAHRALTD